MPTQPAAPIQLRAINIIVVDSVTHPGEFCAGLAGASLGLPKWQRLNIDVNGTKYEVGVGLFATKCPDAIKLACENAFQNSPGWVTLSTTMMFIALSCMGAAGVLACIACCACCGKKCIGLPLPFLCAGAAACLLTAVINYGTHIQEAPGDLPDTWKLVENKDGVKGMLGLSVILAIVSTVLMIGNMIVAVIFLKVQKIPAA